jgi:hypothetical protein
MHRVRTIHYERWQLHVNEAECSQLFEGMEAEDDDVL